MIDRKLLLPGTESYIDMTPTEFEHYCIHMLKKQFGSENNYTFKHNVNERSHDGTYQIDGEITYIVGGMNFKILVECKKHKKPIPRDVVVLLDEKVRSIGAQKGIIISTSSFQSGALRYAKEHGIALAQVFNGQLRFEARTDYNYKPKHINTPGTYEMALLTYIDEKSISISHLDYTDGMKKYIMEEMYCESNSK